MLDLDVIEARVPNRTPRMPERPAEPPIVRFAPFAALFGSPIFSRTRDIFAANMTELLDRSEDPSRMIRMIILEMEETLVDVRASAAR
uniref:PspA/IM30 family protein n=1 Tax=Sphingomonas sp. TaxID=28214 RepID=UPI00286B9CEF